MIDSVITYEQIWVQNIDIDRYLFIHMFNIDNCYTNGIMDILIVIYFTGHLHLLWLIAGISGGFVLVHCHHSQKS